MRTVPVRMRPGRSSWKGRAHESTPSTPEVAHTQPRLETSLPGARHIPVGSTCGPAPVLATINLMSGSNEGKPAVRQLFGTDGIRGKAGEYPLDQSTAFAVGLALAKWIGTNHLDPEVVLGMDTRESGPWIAEYVAGGLKEGGVGARFAGLITTPGLAHVARTGPFAAGVMISASHNPFQDNGIKIFDHSGFKLPDAQEQLLEQHIFEWAATGAAPIPENCSYMEYGLLCCCCCCRCSCGAFSLYI